MTTTRGLTPAQIADIAVAGVPVNENDLLPYRLRPQEGYSHQVGNTAGNAFIFAAQLNDWMSL